MQPVKMYSVVKFLNSDDVEIVSTNWLCDTENGRFCLWPQHFKPQNLKRALLEGRKPDVSWIPSKVSILGTYDSYPKARQKLKHVENALILDSGSHINSAKKQGLNQKEQQHLSEKQNNKRMTGNPSVQLTQIDCSLIKQEPPDSEGSDRECCSAKTPTASNQVGLYNNQRAVQKSKLAEKVLNLETEIEVPPAKRLCSSQAEYHSDSSSSEKNDQGTSKSTRNLPPSPQIVYCSVVQQQAQDLEHSDEECDPSGVIVLQDGDCIDLQSILNPVQEDGPSHRDVMTQTIEESSLADFPHASPVEKHLIKSMEDLKRTVNHSIFSLNKLISHCTKPGELSFSESCLDIESLLPTLPLNSLLEFEEWEAFLRIPESFKLAVQYLSGKGGANVNEATKRVLQLLMTRNLASQLNWCGRGNKSGVKETKTTRLVIHAVKGNGMLISVTDKEIETSIKTWLKYAPLRVRYYVHKDYSS